MSARTIGLGIIGTALIWVWLIATLTGLAGLQP